MKKHTGRGARSDQIRLRAATVRLALLAGLAPLAACSSGSTNAAPYSPTVQSIATSQTSSSASPESEIIDTSRAVTAAAVQGGYSGSTGRQIFYDDFKGDKIGVLPSGWTQAAGTGVTCAFASQFAALCETGANGGVSRPILASQSSWSDYSVDALASRHLNGSANGGTMLIGRVVDMAHFYGLELRPDIQGSGREFWYIHRHDQNGWTELTGGPFTPNPVPFYRLRLNFAGSRISAYVAYDFSSTFQPLGSVTDGSFAGGGIALRTWGSSTESFTDVRVTLNTNGSPSPVAPTSTPSSPPSAAPTSAPTTRPTSAPTARPTAAPTTRPTVAPTTGPTVSPTTDPQPDRTSMFDSNAGSAYEQTSRGYGEIQPPTFSGHAPTCTSAEYPQCSGESGAATFHITRPSLTNSGGSWRSMQTLLPHPIEPNGMYDVAFRTTTNSPQDVPGSQNLIFQVHPNPGNVNTALGLENDGTGGTYWYMNTAGVLGIGANTPYGRHRTWQAPYVVGETDDWEIQFKNTTDSSGFVYLYRNGLLVDKYNGPNVVPTTAYTELGWGIYEYHWENSTASNALSESITFQNMRIYKIPGPVPQISSF